MKKKAPAGSTFAIPASMMETSAKKYEKMESAKVPKSKNALPMITAPKTKMAVPVVKKAKKATLK